MSEGPTPQQRFGLKRVIFVGDRGMVKSHNLPYIGYRVVQPSYAVLANCTIRCASTSGASSGRT
jgi:hypothetical protein